MGSSIVSSLLDLLCNNLLTVALFLVVFYTTWRILSRPKRLPPGPSGVPVLGYLPFLNKEGGMGPIAIKYGKKFNSDMVYLDLWTRKFVVLNSYEKIKELFQKREDCMDRISDNLFAKLMTGHQGLVFSNGALWKEHRRFSLSVLRDFGMGKIAAEEIITEELGHLVREMEDTAEASINPRMMVTEAISNIICSFIFGQRYEYENEDFLQLVQHVNQMTSDFDKPSKIVLWKHWMRYLPDSLDMIGFKAVQANVEGIMSFTRARIAEHQARFDPGCIKDYIDMYLLRMKEGNESFTDFQLGCEIFDLFFAGTETTATTLRWAIYYMAKYPEIQERVQGEIEAQIGRDRLPTMKDKLLLPYTEAVLMEVQRMATILSTGVFHSNHKQDITIGDYVIPKNTIVAPNLLAVHRDPDTWPDPENFNPSNFLDGEGKLRNQDRLIPFSIGRRSCIGEALAKMELFLFFTGWLQRFNIVSADRSELDAAPVGVISQPAPFHVQLRPRTEE